MPDLQIAPALTAAAILCRTHGRYRRQDSRGIALRLAQIAVRSMEPSILLKTLPITFFASGRAQKNLLVYHAGN
jgi:hypothetical protein